MPSTPELSAVEMSTISVEHLARRIFDWAKRRAGTDGVHRIIEYLRCRNEFAGEHVDAAFELKFDDAFFRLVERGLIRWREGASYSTGNWTFTERGRGSNFGDVLVDDPEPALADLRATVGHDLDPVLSGYLREALAAYRAQRLTSAQICMGVVAERAAILLEGWLVQYTSLKTKSHRWASERLEECAKALAELKGKRPDLEKVIEALEDAMTYLGEEYRATRNEVAHPILPPKPDDDLLAAQLRALVRTYIPAVYRLIESRM